MRRLAPGLLAVLVWNGVFDLQVRRAGEQVTARQVAAWQAGGRPPLLREVFAPEVRAAALQATAVSMVLLLVGVRLARGTSHP